METGTGAPFYTSPHTSILYTLVERMFDASEVLYGILDALAKVYGLKVVIKICQQFIIDSIADIDSNSSVAPPPGPVAVAPKKD